jgi:class 3 adenylate cyclase
VVDFDALEAAGIANARGRAGLIEYLVGLGFTVAEMVEAERQGRLFGLAGDALQGPGRPTYSMRTGAQKLGVTLEELTTVWTAMGLPLTDPDTLSLSQLDIDGLAKWVAVKELVGDEPALGFLRIMGNALARVAEAAGTMVRMSQPDVLMAISGDELTTARAYRAVTETTHTFGVLMDVVFRHHTISARTHFEHVITDASATVTCGVGFADLTGFTQLTQVLNPTELFELLTDFGGSVSDMVHTDGGRLVKFIGDEVMWVTTTPDLLVKVAIDLVEHPRARATGLNVRAGLGYGQVLAIGGDYFGTPVNLAARLVAAAAPGQILASTDVRDELSDWPAIPQEPLTLKGFDKPVPAYDLHLSR